MATIGEQLGWIRAATRAPSLYNTQPWSFEITGSEVALRPDVSRQLRVADPLGRELWMSLGCAAENMVVAARHGGELLEVSLASASLPLGRGLVLRARRDRTSSDGLYQAIFERQTNRRLFDGRELERSVLETLDQVALEPGVSMRVLRDHSFFPPFERLIREAVHAQLGSQEHRRELFAWTRFGESEEAAHLDGLSAQALSERSLPGVLGRLSLPWLMRPARQARAQIERLNSSSALLLLATKEDDPQAWVAAGRALERVLLHLTLLGVQHAYLNQPIQVPELRMKLAHETHLSGERPQVLLRLGHAETAPRAPRRPLEEVVFLRPETGERVPIPTSLQP